MSSDAFLAVLLTGQEAASVNPLAAIDADAPEFVTQCHALACRLLARQNHYGQRSAPAELVLLSLIAFVCACEPAPEARTLMTVRQLLGDRRKLDRSFELMEKCDHPVIAELGTWYMSACRRS
jgi:hypothetical protein